ncbi:hypothetical protein SAMN04487948_11232 [Halogranum amylolyticum]|uniref:Uncharacterized protein n=1 Tax=Halogranum amylolyticum TaxID=660520 RepID=A0A1H8UQA9_9EURY|nr:helix-turn-helix domain-containing protein [Halogranum amylolyticum]SEP05399.1 hypothetical protein SAMN04487948_11232 [Halogranum amylolyticum]
MAEGIHAEIELACKGACSIAALSENSTISSVKRGNPNGSDLEPVEFTVESGDDPGNMEPLFSYESKRVYRTHRHVDHTCPCDHIEQYDCLVRDVYAEHGQLRLTFFTYDTETLRQIIAELEAAYGTVHIRRLTQSQMSDGDSSLVFLDRSLFTRRQLEILEVAHEMGYFEYPKGANAKEVAAEIGVSRSTFVEHLSAAQTKLLNQLLG